MSSYDIRPRPSAFAWGVSLLVLAVAVIAGLVGFFQLTFRGQLLDVRVTQGVWTSSRIDAALAGGLELVSVAAVAAVLVALGVFGALRGRPALAFAAAGVIAGANVTTQLLKYRVLPRADFGWSGPNTLPSGHVTVITSVVVAALFVMPSRWRRTALALASFLVGCSVIGTMVLGWHRPSDVMAATAVVMAWTGLAAVALTAWGRVGGVRGLRGPWSYVLTAVAGGAVLGVLVLAAGIAPVESRATMVFSAAGLALTALACAVMLGLAAYVVDLLGEALPSRSSTHARTRG